MITVGPSSARSVGDTGRKLLTVYALLLFSWQNIYHYMIMKVPFIYRYSYLYYFLFLLDSKFHAVSKAFILAFCVQRKKKPLYNLKISKFRANKHVVSH